MAIYDKKSKEQTEKKPKMSRTKRLFSRIFQIRAWSDWDRVKSGFWFLVDKIKKYFVPNAIPRPKATVNESASTISHQQFEEAITKMDLSAAELGKREKSLLRLSQYMMAIAVLVFCYFIYHLIFGTASGAILTFAVLCISLAFSFRYHFWYFQIREKKLGCSLSQWYKQGLWGRK